MHPLKIRLQGDYWDSTVYNDKLILVLADGTVETYSWDRIVSLLISRHDDLEVPLRHLLARGKAWYGLATQDLIATPVTRAALSALAEAAAAERFTVSRTELVSLRQTVSEMSLFPTTDLECYANTLFVGSTDGLLATPLATSDLETSSNAKIYDGPSLRLAASYRRLAIAQGADGLAETPVATPEYPLFGDGGPRTISSRRCDDCSWLSFDIVATERGHGGYIGAFEKPEPRTDKREPARPNLVRTVASQDVFAAADGTMIGAGDTLALIRNSEIRVGDWKPFSKVNHSDRSLGRSRIRAERSTFWHGDDVVDARLAVFGVVIEYDNRLVIAGTDGERLTLRGEPVAWRVFPRSERYINQLHIVRERGLDVLAFTHDYFVPRSERTIGAPRPHASTW